MILILSNDERYTLHKDDRIFFNGTDYYLITRKSGPWWNKHSPEIPNHMMEQILSHGNLKEYKPDDPPYIGERFKYFKISNTEVTRC